MPAFRFLCCDNEQSYVHAHVAAPEFLVNVPTHQFCQSCTDSDHVILQQEIETTHVSHFQPILHSPPVGFAHLVEPLPNGAELRSDYHADAGDFAFDAVEVLPLLY